MGILSRSKTGKRSKDILAGKQEFDVPAERRYLAGEIGDVAQRDRHAALVVGVESHPARAGGIEACEFGLAYAHVDCDDAARTIGRLGVECRHAVENGGVIGAVDKRLGEQHPIDAQDSMQFLEIGQCRLGRVVAAARGQSVAPLKYMHVRVDRAGRQHELWFARVADRWETIFDLGTHDAPILLPPLRHAETELNGESGGFRVVIGGHLPSSVTSGFGTR